MKVDTESVRQILLLLSALLFSIEARAQYAQLVRDIKTTPAGSSPQQLVEAAGVVFFTPFFDPAIGIELWKTDGTEPGTVLVKDIVPGPDSSFPFGLTNVNGTLFFAAFDAARGSELWKSDGTAAGTVLVKDISPFQSPFQLTNVNGTLFFSASGGLWKSDGTAAGTVLVKDISP